MAKAFKSLFDTSNNHQVSSPSRRRGSTKQSKGFKSWVNIQEESTEVESSSLKYPVSSNDVSNEPTLLKGEVIIDTVSSVHKFHTFTDRKHGKLGTLYCTNFRLIFVSVERSRSNEQSQKNYLLGEDDIALANIDTLTQVSSRKRRRLPPGTNVSDRVKTLEVGCKDFGVHTFGLKMVTEQAQKKFVNTLLHHAFPSRIDLLFAFDYQGEKLPQTDTEYHTPQFKNARDWERELERLRCGDSWRVTHINEKYQVSTTMAEYFVVPKLPFDTELKNKANRFKDDRLPAWCYSHENGSAIVRMCNTRTDQNQAEHELIDSIRLVHRNKRQPFVVNLNERCPSVRDLAVSFEKLKALCMPVGSLKEFWSIDSNWYGSLDSTQWLTHVTGAIRAAVDAAKAVTDEREPKTVIIKEFDGRDFACVVSSLALVILDPVFRTITGFQALIQREWVAMGHRFTARFYPTLDSEAELSPVFLLFLDCVWQIMQQFPVSFEFSETYLIRLWDNVHTGIFGTFLFDSPHHCHNACHPNKFDQEPRYDLLSVWNWDRQFSTKELTLFKNPLFIACHELTISGEQTGSSTQGRIGNHHDGQMPGGATASREDTVPLSHLFAGCKIDTPETVLHVSVKGSAMSLWSQCYLRWASPVEIAGGGAPARYLQQCLLVEEILHLQHTLDVEQTKGTNTSVPTKKNKLFFSLSAGSAPDRTDLVTSSFPFTPGTPGTMHSSCLGTPLSLFMEKSALKFIFEEGDERDDE